jgi:hypothetical protein
MCECLAALIKFYYAVTSVSRNLAFTFSFVVLFNKRYYLLYHVLTVWTSIRMRQFWKPVCLSYLLGTNTWHVCCGREGRKPIPSTQVVPVGQLHWYHGFLLNDGRLKHCVYYLSMRVNIITSSFGYQLSPLSGNSFFCDLWSATVTCIHDSADQIFMLCKTRKKYVDWAERMHSYVSLVFANFHRVKWTKP